MAAYTSMNMTVPPALQIEALQAQLKEAEAKNQELAAGGAKTSADESKAAADKAASPSEAAVPASTAAAAAPSTPSDAGASPASPAASPSSVTPAPVDNTPKATKTDSADAKAKAPDAKADDKKEESSTAAAPNGAAEVTKLIGSMGADAAKWNPAAGAKFQKLQQVNLIQQSLLKNMLDNANAASKPNTDKEQQDPEKAAVQQALGIQPNNYQKQLQLVQLLGKMQNKGQDLAPMMHMAQNTGLASPNDATAATAVAAPMAGMDALSQLGISGSPSSSAQVSPSSTEDSDARSQAAKLKGKDDAADVNTVVDSMAAPVAKGGNPLSALILANLLKQQQAKAGAAGAAANPLANAAAAGAAAGAAAANTNAAFTPDAAAGAADVAVDKTSGNAALTPNFASTGNQDNTDQSMFGDGSGNSDSKDDSGLISLLDSAGLGKHKHKKRHHKMKPDSPYSKIGYEEPNNSAGTLSKRQPEPSSLGASLESGEKYNPLEAPIGLADDDVASKKTSITKKPKV